MPAGFSLPTPKEADYYQDNLIDAALEKIKLSINQGVFSFKPISTWNFVQMSAKLNMEIRPFGWEITQTFAGTQDDGYETWTLKPL